MAKSAAFKFPEQHQSHKLQIWTFLLCSTTLVLYQVTVFFIFLASWLKQSNQISIYIIFLSPITNITTPPPLLIHLAAPAECSFQHLMLMPASDHRLLHHHRRRGSTQSRNDDCRLRVCRLFISEFISVHRDSSAMLQQVFHRSRV